MSIKILYIAFSILLTSIEVHAQQLSKTIYIREVARNYLIKYKELNVDANTKSSNNIILKVYDVINDVEVRDSTALIPTSASLSHYRILAFGAHTYTHLIFAKNGNYVVINMRDVLTEIMRKTIHLCQIWNLDTQDSLYIINDVLLCYQLNTQKND